MQLEAANAKLANEPPRFTRTGLAFGGIDAGEGNEHVAVGGRLLGTSSFGVAAVAGLAFGIDRKNHRADFAFAIIGSSFLDRGLRLLGWLK